MEYELPEKLFWGSQSSEDKGGGGHSQDRLEGSRSEVQKRGRSPLQPQPRRGKLRSELQAPNVLTKAHMLFPQIHPNQHPPPCLAGYCRRLPDPLLSSPPPGLDSKAREEASKSLRKVLGDFSLGFFPKIKRGDFRVTHIRYLSDGGREEMLRWGRG